MKSLNGAAASWADVRREVERRARAVDPRVRVGAPGLAAVVVVLALWPEPAPVVPPPPPARVARQAARAPRVAPTWAASTSTVTEPVVADPTPRASDDDLLGIPTPARYAPALGLAGDDGVRADVDPTTGLLTIFETDVDLSGVALRRARTSGDLAPGAFGRGWRAEHEARVRVTDDGLVVHRLQGLSAFVALEGDVYVTAAGEVEHLRWSAAGFELLEATGRVLRFDPAGALVEVAPGYRVARAPGRVVLANDAAALTLELDGAGRVARAHGARDEVSLTYDYDAAGELRAVRGALERDYDVVSRGRPDDDDEGRISAVRRGALELLGARHDGNGRIAELWVPGWRQSYRFSDDAAGRVVLMTCPGGSWRYTLSDERWAVATPTGAEQVTFDERGRLTSLQRPGDARPLERGFDPLGRGAPLAPSGNHGRALPGGAVVRERRDARGRVEVVFTDTTPPVSETYTWTADGRVASNTAPDGRTTTWEYGPVAQGSPIVAEVGPAGRTTYAWVGEKLARVGTPGGRSWWFEWSEAGHLEATQGPAGRMTYRRSPTGQPLERADASGRVVEYGYDAVGRPATIRARGAAGSARLDYAWDEQGELARVTGPLGAIEVRRDGGQVETRDGATGARVIVRRDRALERVETPWGEVVREHDALGRLVGLRTPAGRFRFAYDAQGQRTSLVFPNGVGTTVGYDGLGRATSLTSSARSGERVLDLRHAFSDRHERVKTERDGVATSFAYDAAGRLARAERAGVANTWDFDADGNRAAAGEVVSTFDLFGRVATVGEARAAHDAAGRLTALGDDEFDYDAFGRLSRVRRAGRPEVAYAWDALGRLAARKEGERIVHYVWDGPRLLAEIDPRGALERLWVHGPDLDEPLAYRDGEDGPWTFLHADDLGHVLAYSDEAGRRVDGVVYDPWGAVVEGPSSARPLFFSGRLYDPVAGLVLLRARPYDPALGRFLVPDPSGLHGGTNAYAYVSGNPVEYVDPLGLWEVPGWARRSGAWLGDRWNDTKGVAVDAATGLGHLTGITGTEEEIAQARRNAQSRSLGAVDGFVGFMAFDLWDPNVSRWAYDQEMARQARVYGEGAALGLTLASGVGAVRALPAVVVRGGRALPGLVRSAPGTVRGVPAALTRAPAAVRDVLARSPAWLRDNAVPLARATAAFLRDQVTAPFKPLVSAAQAAVRGGRALVDTVRGAVSSTANAGREVAAGERLAARPAQEALPAGTSQTAVERQRGLAQHLDPEAPLGNGPAPAAARVADALPDASRATIDVEGKLVGYALNPAHPKGKDKAVVFQSALGYNQTNAADLAAQLQAGLRNNPAVHTGTDQFGQRFRVDIPVTGPGGTAVVRTGWIVEPGGAGPRLTTAFVR
jgi:RHS repeat-associated protein